MSSEDSEFPLNEIICHLLVKFILQLFENKANSRYLDIWKQEGLDTPFLAWHGYRGCLCLCLRLAGSSMLQIGGGKLVHTARGRGCGVNLGSSVGL